MASKFKVGQRFKLGSLEGTITYVKKAMGWYDVRFDGSNRDNTLDFSFLDERAELALPPVGVGSKFKAKSNGQEYEILDIEGARCAYKYTWGGHLTAGACDLSVFTNESHYERIA